ncbi:MAG: hypothetical protein ACREH8_09565 [Opitutaceae bacterium]
MSGVHDTITTNIANGVILASETSLADIRRDVVTAGDLYVNDREFRQGVTEGLAGVGTGIAVGGAPGAFTRNVAAEKGLIRFSQENVGRTFQGPETSPFKYAGKSIDEVAKGLRSGAIKPSELPVRYIVENGVKIAVDNRSLLALRRAGLEPTVMTDVTGNAALRAQTLARVAEQLNGVPSSTIRIRGAGPNASSIR